MKLRTIFSALLLTQLGACSYIINDYVPQADIDADKARIDFFAQTSKNEKEYVRLLCWNKRPSDVLSIRNIDAGEHNLYFYATVVESKYTPLVAIGRLDASLKGGKRYSLLQSRQNENMKIWLAESDTGVLASDIINVKLEAPKPLGNSVIENCKEGTI